MADDPRRVAIGCGIFFLGLLITITAAFMWLGWDFPSGFHPS
jgi:hypothetical protein